MRLLVATVMALTLLGSSAQAGTRTGQLKLYAKSYATYQGWLLTDMTRIGWDNTRARFILRFLANPAPGTDGCYAEVVTVDSCPAKWYADDFPFYMRVEAVVSKCGPGWFVVSTPLDLHDCGARLPSWSGY